MINKLILKILRSITLYYCELIILAIEKLQVEGVEGEKNNKALIVMLLAYRHVVSLIKEEKKAEKLIKNNRNENR